jgi:hypothetical protein
MRLFIATILLTVSVHAATLADARRVVQTLNEILTARDEDRLRVTFGPTAYRRGSGPVRWGNVQQEVDGLRAAVDNPVRTFSAEGIVTVFGWCNGGLCAAHFITRRGTLTPEALLGIHKARTAAERDVVARYIRGVSEERLREAFVGGNGSAIEGMKREVNRLVDAAASPTPAAPTDSLDALLQRYARVWFSKDCSAVGTVYVVSATLQNSIKEFDFAGIRQYCGMVAPNPGCTVNVLTRQETPDGLRVRAKVSCPPAHGDLSSMRWEISLQIATSSGAYRIQREEQTQ